jgi:protein SCO1
MLNIKISAVCFLLGACACILPVVGHAGPTADVSKKVSIPDACVVTSKGERLRFNSDLVKGRIAVINFIYTDCTRICPRQGKTFAGLSEVLGDRLNKDVVLISISLAPETDTPEKLADWASGFSPRPGWIFLTGAPAEVWPLIRSLAPVISQKSGHDATAVVWHEASGTCVYKYGLDSSQSFLETINLINASKSKD